MPRHSYSNEARAALGVLGAALAFASCAGCTDKAGSVPSDAGVDSLAEAAPRDAGPGDAAPDAPDPEDGGDDWPGAGWDVMPCPASPCGNWIARSPATTVSALTWRACTSGRTGCQELVVDWTTKKGNTVSFEYDSVFPSDDARVLLVVTRRFQDVDYLGANRFIAGVHDLATGQAVFARANRGLANNDGFSNAAYDRAGVLIGLESKSLDVQRYRRSTWPAPLTFTQVDVPVASLAPGKLGPIDKSGPSVLQTMLDPQVPRVVDPAGTVVKVPATFDSVRSVTAGFLTRQFATGFPLALVGPTGTLSRVRTPETGKVVRGYNVDRTDADRLVWIEVNETGSNNDAVLYQSPFASSEAGLSPARVTGLPGPSSFGGAYITVANGHALFLMESTRAMLVRLSDGARWTIDADSGKWFGQPLWVDDTEIWLSSATIRGTSADEDSIVRLRRDALGPASLPPL